MKTLAAWIGTQDIEGFKQKNKVGPIISSINHYKFNNLILLTNNLDDHESYSSWIKDNYKIDVKIFTNNLKNPTDISEIYNLTRKVLLESNVSELDYSDIFYHLSPGTWAMAFVWLLISQSEFPGILIKSSFFNKKEKVEEVEIPFEVSSRWIKNITSKQGQGIIEVNRNFNKNSLLSFSWQSFKMVKLLKRINIISKHCLPTCVFGSNGTEKDAVAKTIHEEGRGILDNFYLFDSLMMNGNEFKTRLLEIVNNNDDELVKTIYIPHLHLLPVEHQKYLGLVLNKKLQLNNSNKLRIICSANKTLIKNIENGNFDESLFHKLNCLSIDIPDLKERNEDYDELFDYLLLKINIEIYADDKTLYKQLSPSARSILKSYSWPGNIDEIKSLFTKLVVLEEEKIITEPEIYSSIYNFQKHNLRQNNILKQPFNSDFDLHKIIGEVVKSYIPKALDISKGNKSKAADLLGLPSHQTLTNWIQRYEVTHKE